MNTQTRNLLGRIAASWSREKDQAQPRGLELEIQFQLGCSYGRAAGYANDVRVGKFSKDAELARELRRAERQDSDVMLARTVAAQRGATPVEIQRAVLELEGVTYPRHNIISAIADCDRFIEREEKRDPSLRPADGQKVLDQYKAHRIKLQNMLVESTAA